MESGISVVDLELDSEVDLEKKEIEAELSIHYMNKHTKSKIKYP